VSKGLVLPIKIALSETGQMPTKGTDGATGWDLYASQAMTFGVGDIFVVEVGIYLEIPKGWGAEVRPRSGMSKRGLWVAVGTIDSDYRGIVGAVVANLSRETQHVSIGDRVAQLVIEQTHPVLWEPHLLSELTKTDRGQGAFGSTGK
jgi:dUTP pyrophosphatase